MICTTLNKIRAHDPCTSSWTKLLAALGKTQADDDPLPMSRILDICGLDDCLWAARSLPDHEREWRLFACDCAERVLMIFEKERPGDERPRNALDVARRFAAGEATAEELAAARAAAWDAEAAGAARDARDAAEAAWAARDARDAAWAAWAASAAEAAWAAEAARDAAGADEREWQTTRLLDYLDAPAAAPGEE